MKVSKILDKVNEKNWSGVVQLVLFAMLTAVWPFAMKTIGANLLIPITEDVKEIQTIQEKQVLGAGIAGYSKIGRDLSKMETSTQNAEAIRLALSIPTVRETLLLLNRECTLMYEEYFRMN